MMTQNSPNDVPTQTTAVSRTGSLSASERRPLAASHLPAPEFKALSEATLLSCSCLHRNKYTTMETVHMSR